MTSYRSNSGSGHSRGDSGKSSGGAGSSNSSNSSFRDVSAARLDQRSGSNNSFGGYTKVNRGDGTFRMRPTGK